MMNLVRIKFGSHLYGTSTPESDLDYKSVHVPAARDILLQRAAAVVGVKVKAREGVRNAPGDVDDESYALHRYLQLLAEGQTVAVDMLFAPEWSWVSPAHALWRHIQLNAGRLVTRKSAAFVGYCRTQANKYGIKGSRVAAARAATEFFAEQLARLGPQARVLEVAALLPALCVDEHTQLVSAPVKEQVSTNSDGWEFKERNQEFFECCNRKVEFGNTVKAAWEMYKRVWDRVRRARPAGRDQRGRRLEGFEPRRARRLGGARAAGHRKGDVPHSQRRVAAGDQAGPGALRGGGRADRVTAGRGGARGGGLLHAARGAGSGVHRRPGGAGVPRGGGQGGREVIRSLERRKGIKEQKLRLKRVTGQPGGSARCRRRARRQGKPRAKEAR